MRYLLLCLALTGCATVDVYSIAPQNDLCKDIALKHRNYCTTTSEKDTLDCFTEVKKSCRKRHIIFK